MLFKTERGSIAVEALAYTTKQAESDGYRYAFHSDKLGLDVYSKTEDVEGHLHSFKILVDRNITDRETFGKLVEFDLFETDHKNEPEYAYYKPFGNTADNADIILTDAQIPVYNEIVEELNADCAWLRKYNTKYGEHAADREPDPFDKEHFKRYSDLYERYLNIREAASNGLDEAEKEKEMEMEMEY